MEEGVRRYSASELAFVGDSVYELAMRRAVLCGEREPLAGLSESSQAFTNAAAQAKILSSLLPCLTEEEAAVVHKGRNARVKSAPKSAGIQKYREATALECLFGYTYLSGRKERLEELSALAVRAARSGKGQNGEGSHV
jgi:ribonuclease-3 family protein